MVTSVSASTCNSCICACACVYVHVWCVCMCVCDLPSGSDETADIETLVDDFVTFFVAGEAMSTLCD